MTSRTRLIANVLLVVCALTGAAACSQGDQPKPAAKASNAASSAPQGGAPKPSAPAGKPSASWVPTNSAYANVCQTKLPKEAQDTLGLIAKGGPYPYRSDGIVFENRENRLPRENAGYYHEFTVVTPGADDRGTRRIVTGTAGEEYWTGDHYSTFQQVDARC